MIGFWELNCEVPHFTITTMDGKNDEILQQEFAKTEWKF